MELFNFPRWFRRRFTRDQRVRIIKGDITTLNVDAIVNAANSNLYSGGGVCGAIHAAAGPELESVAKRYFGYCPTGQAVMTPGFKLLAKSVIHAVGPVYKDGKSGERELLRSAYENSLDIADGQDYETIAFPLISGGIYGYPPREAVSVAFQAVCSWLRTNRNTSIKEVTFVAFDEGTKELMERIW